MTKRDQAQRLRENPLLPELLDTWRQDVIDAMLHEPKRKARERLWREQAFLERLSERIFSELDSFIAGRESDSE